MFKMVNKRLKNKKGFTLVELIVVIAILGILAAIAVPKFSGFRDTAAKQADEASMKVLEDAARMYYTENPDSNTGTFTSSSSSNLDDYLDEWPEPQQSSVNGFSVTISNDGDVEVTTN